MATKADQGEVIGAEPVERLEAFITGAIRRKPSQEAKLAGALRALAPYSPRLTECVAGAVDTLIKRSSFGRPLYAGGVRSVALSDGRHASLLLGRALGAEDCGGLPTLSAACFVQEKGLSPALERAAASRHPHLAFGAEVARIARGESGGQHIAAVAPKIKESHRISLCVEIFVPLLHHAALPQTITPALRVLRDAERHLGRWLVLGQIASRAGDERPLLEARERATSGPLSARAAWSFVAWALAPQEGPPSARPTVELVSRLSDRPSSDRDPTFLYRLADARVPTAKAMLENLVKGSTLRNEAGVRAAMYLAANYGRDDLHQAIASLAANPRHEALRGLATAALLELGDRRQAFSLAEDLAASRNVTTMAWAGLVRAAEAGKLDKVMTEPTFRRVQLGWVE